jgi:hypothetical protein
MYWKIKKKCCLSCKKPGGTWDGLIMTALIILIFYGILKLVIYSASEHSIMEATGHHSDTEP